MLDPFVYVLPTDATAPRYARLRAAEAAAAATLRKVCEPSVDPNALMVGVRTVPTPADFAAVNAACKALYDCILAVCPPSADRSTAERCARHARMCANESMTMICQSVDAFTPGRMLDRAFDALRDARMWACSSIALAAEADLPTLPD